MLTWFRREHGQDLIEYAIILPILVLLVIGILELSMIVFSYNTIADAAREGARYGVIHPTNTAGINTATRRLTTGLNPAQLTVTSSLPGGNVIRVEVTYNLHLITSLIAGVFGQPTMRLRAVTTMQIE
jgi:Flp pilus assembly protein TadG